MLEGTQDEESGVYIPPQLDAEQESGSDIPVIADDYSSPDQPNINTTNGTPFVLPVWLRESSKSFHWRWAPLPLRKAGRAIVRWVKGPVPPRTLLLKPFFPQLQELPSRCLERFFPKRRHKAALLLLLYFVWFLPWFVILLHSRASGYIQGYGRPQTLSCTSSYWYCLSSMPLFFFFFFCCDQLTRLYV